MEKKQTKNIRVSKEVHFEFLKEVVSRGNPEQGKPSLVKCADEAIRAWIKKGKR